eukprot:1243298-Pleurochrysis_carterae.AAC.2
MSIRARSRVLRPAQFVSSPICVGSWPVNKALFNHLHINTRDFEEQIGQRDCSAHGAQAGEQPNLCGQSAPEIVVSYVPAARQHAQLWFVIWTLTVPFGKKQGGVSLTSEPTTLTLIGGVPQFAEHQVHDGPCSLHHL